MKFVEEWTVVLSELEDYRKEKLELEYMMKPIIDSYRDCDFKIIDRELVSAVIDMFV